MTALQGRIEPGTVANVLQYLALGRASGRLTLVHEAALQGHVWFDAGRVVCVEARPFRDASALGALLAWDEGRFAFRDGEAPPLRSMDDEVEVLLLKAARRPERLRPALAAAQLGPDAVLAAARSDESVTVVEASTHAPPGEVLLSLAALHLWRRLDGASSLRQLAEAGGRGVDELVAAAGELMDHGLAEFAWLVVADPRFAEELAREAVDLVGPVGAVIVEDAFHALGLQPHALPVEAVDELLAELGRSFPGVAVSEFMWRAEALRDLFALEPAPLERAR